jgi:hypothetical protein
MAVRSEILRRSFGRMQNTKARPMDGNLQGSLDNHQAFRYGQTSSRFVESRWWFIANFDYRCVEGPTDACFGARLIGKTSMEVGLGAFLLGICLLD